MIIRTRRHPTTPDGIDKFDGHPRRTILECVESSYQRVEIAHHPVFGNQLIIDGDLQVSESDHAYNAALVAPLLTLRQCREVLILGGGDGGVLAELVAAADEQLIELHRATLVDIDPVVLDLSRRYLPNLHRQAFDHPAAQVVTGDAFACLETLSDLDAVIYDLTMEPIRPGLGRRDYITEVVASIAAALRPGGVISMQCCGLGNVDPRSVRDREQLMEAIHSTLARDFYSLVEQRVVIPSFGEPWLFLCGARRDPKQ